MALVLAGKLLAICCDTRKNLTLKIRPTTTIQQDGKTFVVMIEEPPADPAATSSVALRRVGHVFATDEGRIDVLIEYKDGDSLVEFIQATPVDQTVRLAVKKGTKATVPKVTISKKTYTLVSFRRGGL